MRIGLFTDSYTPQINGVTISVIMLADGLRNLGHEVFIITTNHKDAKKEAYTMRLKGIPVPLKTMKGYQLVFLANRYLINIKALNLDIIHVHTEFSIGRFGLRCSKKLNIPMIYTLHTMYEEYMHHVVKYGRSLFKGTYLRYVKNILEWFTDYSKAVVLPHEKVRTMLDKYRVLSEIVIIPSGIDLERFYKTTYKKEQVAELKKQLGLENEKVLLFIGRVAPEKSIDLIVKAFAKEVNNINAKLVIVGDGPALANLKQLAINKKIEEYVIFTGAIPWQNIGLYYQIADCFVNASKSETQGLTYIEAMAASLPVLVRYDTNLDGLVEDGVNGLFFQDDEDFNRKLNMLLLNKELMETLSKNALPSVAKFSKEKYAEDISMLYERIANK